MSEDLEPGTADGRQRDPAAVAAQSPLLVASGSAAPSIPVTTRPLSLAFLAAAVVALLGGLAWAGISVATGYNLGILAWVIGVGTGLTAQRVAGVSLGGFERGLAGVFAAAAVVVGDYVIFVHEVKNAVGSFHAPPGLVSVGYFNGNEIHEFVSHFGTYVHG